MPSVVFDPPRDLTPEERDVLDFVIEANTRYSDKLRALFADSKVANECECGCGTITLTTSPGSVEARTWPSPLPIVVGSTQTVTVEGRPDAQVFKALLFAELDRGGLETLWRPGKGVPFPAKRSLRAISHQWAHGLDRQRGHFWISVETGERRYQEERPADLTDDELDRA
jgi:hypothetical protein